jgi:hypothetical protein
MFSEMFTIISGNETQRRFWLDLPGDPGLYSNLLVRIEEPAGTVCLEHVHDTSSEAHDQATLRVRAVDELLKLERRIGEARLRILAEEVELTRSPIE